MKKTFIYKIIAILTFFPIALPFFPSLALATSNNVNAINTSIDDVVISNVDIRNNSSFLPVIRKGDIKVKIGLDACWNNSIYYIETTDNLHNTTTYIKGVSPTENECSDWFNSPSAIPASYNIVHDKPFAGQSIFFTYHESGTSNIQQIDIRVFEDTQRDKSSSEINNKFKGHIMLKAEDAGQLYYISPVSKKAYYIIMPKHTTQIIRGTSLGISNDNIEKIPVGGACPATIPDCDKPEKHDQNFTNNYKGYIFLQVEKNGESWYVNPKDSKRYYLGAPENAYKIFASAATGISNKNFEKMELAY